MRVLVRNVATKRYFKEPGHWSAKKEQAHDFQTTSHALSDARTIRTADRLEVVFSFGEDKYDIVLPVGALGPEYMGLPARKLDALKPTRRLKALEQKRSNFVRENDLWPIPVLPADNSDMLNHQKPTA